MSKKCLTYSKAWTISQTNTTANVYVKFRDEAGNETSCVSDSIIHDNIPPAINSLKLNNGSSYTNLASINLTSTSMDAHEMYVTRDSGCNSGGSWESYLTTKVLPITNFNSGNGYYYKFRDLAQNETSCTYRSVYHDNIPPDITSFYGTQYTNSPDINLYIAVTYGGTSLTMFLYNNSSCSGSGTESSYPGTNSSINTVNWNLVSGDGVKDVSVKIEDAAGNSSTCKTHSLTLDSIAPSPPSNLVLPSNPASIYRIPSISWDAGSDNIGLSHYNLKIGTTLGDDDITNINVYSSNEVASKLATLSPNANYYVQIFSVDLAGNSSAEALEGSWLSPDCTENSSVFNYTGSIQNITLPSTISDFKYKLWGAGGQGALSTCKGGNGAYVEGVYITNSAQNFYILAGGTGTGAGTSGGSGGGGRSAIFSSNPTVTSSRVITGNEIVTAGGGGGASAYYYTYNGSSRCSDGYSPTTSDKVYNTATNHQEKKYSDGYNYVFYSTGRHSRIGYYPSAGSFDSGGSGGFGGGGNGSSGNTDSPYNNGCYNAGGGGGGYIPGRGAIMDCSTGSGSTLYPSKGGSSYYNENSVGFKLLQGTEDSSKDHYKLDVGTSGKNGSVEIYWCQ